jgi:hypothetical protein
LNTQNSEDCPEVPQNDECENAFNVSTFPFSITGNNELATDNPDRGYGGCGSHRTRATMLMQLYKVALDLFYHPVSDFVLRHL